MHRGGYQHAGGKSMPKARPRGTSRGDRCPSSGAGKEEGQCAGPCGSSRVLPLNDLGSHAAGVRLGSSEGPDPLWG